MTIHQKKKNEKIYLDTDTFINDEYKLKIIQLKEEETALRLKIEEKHKKEIQERELKQQLQKNDLLKKQLQNPILKVIMFWK